MKEIRFFYAPEATLTEELPDDEAMHATRVLRLKAGDEMMLMDGCGSFYRAEVTLAVAHRCMYRIIETIPQQPQWKTNIHIAIAPTKMMERMEWMVEKATEIGINEFSFLNCKFSERKIMKIARLDRIVISAMKQSRKAWKPILHDMETFKEFISKSAHKHKFIAHCYEEVPRTYLFDELREIAEPEDCIVMIGPEGDFSIDEVREAVDAGYISVHLGESRYRTETAALAALMMMQLATPNS
ncbi:MAG: 16S rRNA (uracil(1498)-N(3))-methyltransferase [Prevotella sp.]|nr:16S rRNA (uracil(1498)-N(3))-methyltransferase [Prevotella sp.]